ncbi:CNNM domain-containing protein [Sinomicrobium soli]|uniref:CNNM domain-containing protein n=1 Tax=Sinomicrobium sp. N-1-3-6 TaxID=2219864 RepID=UPI000DCF1E9F|nr:hemolysin family protein [Sinomicrobium sp. N-1-3-6]RAV29178.1 hemolysin [Sinomicrobium sp. N-1-3-6]
MGLLIIYGLGALLLSFVCSVLEAVLLSVSPTYINLKKQEKKSFAYRLEELKSDIDKPLITILTLNTIAHTVGAILVGVQAEKIYGSGNNAVGIVSAVMTALILILSEIIPKTIGATYWKQLTGITTGMLRVMIFPLHYTGMLWLLRLTTRLIGGSQSHGSVFSREDFTAMADIAEQEGVFDQGESKLIKNLLQFGEIHAKDIMTPRVVIKTASEDLTIEEFFKSNPKLRFSRIPVYKGNPDNVTGFILKDEVMEEIIDGNGDHRLSDIRRNIRVIQRGMPMPDLFESFIVQKEHIALVVDEYGAVSGVVTMEDVIETLLGLEIVDESDSVEDLQVLARRNWQLRAKRLGIINDNTDEL